MNEEWENTTDEWGMGEYNWWMRNGRIQLMNEEWENTTDEWGMGEYNWWIRNERIQVVVIIRQTTICEENSYIYRKEYLQERETVSNKNIGLVIE